MNASLKASLQTSRSRARLVLNSLIAAHAAFIGCAAHAQQVTNPGDIVLERKVEPRNAFDSVPRNQEPVLSRATTFPANSFNPAMAQLASDSDLTNARGSTGVASPGALAGTGMQAVTRILSGNTTGNNVALGSGGIGQPAPGIGGTISSTVTGSLAPLSNALSGALGGLK
ncbi:hypothetical protein [Paraburkholderia rhizosphaerae]|uniref:Uncharacterized protein n=1 Tax=Paraburkholderia rhizosphaerae TaxID=480658 RepID=A0A4R8LNF9_9BURK|nr:hypothetical protein [Paraburkholderia rhizosphaerae]TDY47801.1 hypothetical protein BX592_112194 [Paraburkholderia rhizosphaerae]